MADSTPVLEVELITQEKHLLTTSAIKVTAPAILGEVTILPGHIPLFTRLSDGIVTLTDDQNKIHEFAVLGGFMDVGPLNKITILSDAAFSAASINEAKALEAKKRAEEVLSQKADLVDFKRAESELRKAILELKVARRPNRKTSMDQV